jgi:hypothetical protein
MKINYLVFALALLVVTSSCHRKVVIVKTTPGSVKRMPPGQAKKVNGSQSAKAYAPGQQKKKG